MKTFRAPKLLQRARTPLEQRLPELFLSTSIFQLAATSMRVGKHRCVRSSAAPPDLYQSPVCKPQARARLPELRPLSSISGSRRARREQGGSNAEAPRPAAQDPSKRPWPMEVTLGSGEPASGGVDHWHVQLVGLDTADQ
jgi:hypothetical protein